MNIAFLKIYIDNKKLINGCVFEKYIKYFLVFAKMFIKFKAPPWLGCRQQRSWSGQKQWRPLYHPETVKVCVKSVDWMNMHLQVKM